MILVFVVRTYMPITLYNISDDFLVFLETELIYIHLRIFVFLQSFRGE